MHWHSVPQRSAGDDARGGRPGGAHRALWARSAKRRLFSITGSHRSQGPEFCTPEAVLNGSCTLL